MIKLATKMNSTFAEIFNVKEKYIEDFGSFNISLIADIPLFIDPFLLFTSKDKHYQQLHEEIIEYLKFLKEKTIQKTLNIQDVYYLFQFNEVKQNWFGYSKIGNGGTGLGKKFARNLSENLDLVFNKVGSEKITDGSHLEKLCILDTGIGRDHISDFTTNLIKKYLLEYTEKFTKKYIDAKYHKKVNVQKVEFDYEKEYWKPQEFILPWHNNDFVLLTPRNILTKDDTWINKNDLYDDFQVTVDSIPNEQLRSRINSYFRTQIPKKPTKEDITKAKFKTIQKYSELIDYYIHSKELNGDKAKVISNDKVNYIKWIVNNLVSNFINKLKTDTDFYNKPSKSFDECKERLEYFKKFIENNDGYKFFYDNNGMPFRKEEIVQLIFRLVWYNTDFDVNREVNNGRGPADFVVSKGSKDKTVIEFKLAKNPQLKRNLTNQAEIYAKANNTKNILKVIIYFEDNELKKVFKILEKFKPGEDDNIILIDARKKDSASKI